MQAWQGKSGVVLYPLGLGSIPLFDVQQVSAGECRRYQLIPTYFI